MGDGNITWEATDKEKASTDVDEAKVPTLPLSVEVKEDTNTKDTTSVDEATPRSTEDTERSDNVPQSEKSLEVQELHRNTNNSVNTPELSSASIDSPPGRKQETPTTTPRRRNYRGGPPQTSNNEYGLPLGPAAGLGPQEASPDADHEMFSIGGMRSIKINRHRDSVTVFPSGCMGVQDKAKEPVTDSAQESNVGLGRPNSAVRNPLTGEGYDETDPKKQTHVKKRDGNPVLGQGYEDSKNFRTVKVPPGGYSKGLW